MKENNQIADVTWFSDEAHFYLNAQVSKGNCRFWGSEKPDLYLEKNVTREKVYSVGGNEFCWAHLAFFNDESGDFATAI